jgi:hypothetical protein
MVTAAQVFPVPPFDDRRAIRGGGIGLGPYYVKRGPSNV